MDPMPDYERLYHVLNCQRGAELRELRETCEAMCAAMLRLDALLERFHETDRRLETAAVTDGEPTLLAVKGGNAPNEAEAYLHCRP